MDGPDTDYSVVPVTSQPPGIARANIHVKLHEDYNRKHLLPSEENNIDRIWEQRRKDNPKLYNGSKFRFHSLEVDSTSGGVTFCLGLTGYKDYVGTNLADNSEDLLELGRKECSNSQAYMSDALGVGAFVQTADDCIVFMHRSHQVAEAQGLWDVPGGHPEPGEVKGGTGKVEDIVLSDISEQDVKNEIIASVLHEVRDEVNIPESEMGKPHLMGLVKIHPSARRAVAHFFVKCSLHSSEVKELYKAGGLEADESTELKLLPVSEVCKLEGGAMWKNMAPSGKGSIKLYTALMTNSPNA